MNWLATAGLTLLCVFAAKADRNAGMPAPAKGTAARLHGVSPSVAVADFEMAGAQKATEDWSFGLADVLAVQLEERGVTLFERQQIRLVLGERRLTASGLMQLRGSLSQDIPDLEYIVTGSIRALTNRQFHLEAALVEARNGRSAASYSGEGRYPKDLPGALTALADQLATCLNSSRGGQTPDLTTRPNLVHAPEVSLLFYKGVAYCLAGQPEMGVTWFIDAQKVAPNYLAARLWTLRAFEMIGLPDFAEVARRKLRQIPDGRDLLNRLDKSPFLDRSTISLAVVADPRLNSNGWKFQTELKSALGLSTNLFVADPNNIHALAAEMDLQLTEKGARDLELASVFWSAMDALVWVSTDPSLSNSYLVELRDAVSGEPLFRSRSGPDPSAVDEACRNLVRQIETRRLPSPATLSGHPPRTDRAVRPAQVSNTDRNEFAGLLRYLSENPSDRPAWMRLSLFFPWLSGRTDGSYECLMFDRVIAATDLSEPDAPHWLSEALWRKRAYGCSSSIAVDAATLLERFPNTPEGCYARSALALEDIDEQDYAEAAMILLKLADELPRLPPHIKIEPDYWANFYFFTAVALEETGQDARAREFLNQAEAVLREHPDLLIHDGNTYQLGVWVNHFPIHHPLFGPGRDVRQAVAEWQQRLEPVTFASGEDMSLEQLEVLLTRAKQNSASDGWSNRVGFLRRLIEHKQSHPGLYKGRINESVWKGAYREVEAWPNGWCLGYFSLQGKLVMEATTMLHQLATDFPQRLPETRQWSAQLAVHLDPQVAANCFEAVGEYQRALQQVEQAINHPSPFPPSPGMHPTPQQTAASSLRGQKIRLLQELGKADAAATYACDQADSTFADADAQWSAVRDAANACDVADHGEKAIEILASFVRGQEKAGAVTRLSAAARIHWADREMARNNSFEASEILRAVVEANEGRDWGVYLRTGYTKTYDAAIARLTELRTRRSIEPGASAGDTGPVNRSPMNRAR